ncbi:MAG: hypothetical protein LBV79_02585 [Candidatus Adiutrix sp.]|jgi:tRNA (guanine-N7-)-methyltransferase|nr:hypothetical protein [Candidatus Adiutrix sp.]
MTAFSKKFYRSLEPLMKAVDHPRPLDLPVVFGRTAPMEFEIGFGNGEYLHRASLAAPERDFVGVEVAWASLKRALRRLSAPPRPNVRVMLMKAEVALERCFAPESLSVIRALFPVPWPDERRENKRLFQRAFLDLAASRLKSDGAFILVTDSPLLAEWTMGQAENSALRLDCEERPAEMDTKYERKWQGGGRLVFYHITGRKTLTPIVPPPQEIEMQAYYNDDFNPDTYNPQGCAGEIIVKFKEFMFDRSKNQGLTRVMVLEGPLTQEFFIRVILENGRWKFSPAIASQLFPTQGVARALELAAGIVS